MHANRITSVGALKPVIPATLMGGDDKIRR